MQFNQFMTIITFLFLLVWVTACTPLSQPHKPTHKPIPHSIKENNFKLDEITLIYLRNTRFPIHTTISLFNYAYPIILYSRKIIVSPHLVEEVKKAWGNNVFHNIKTTWQNDVHVPDFVHIENICKGLNLFAQNKKNLPSAIYPERRCVEVNEIQFYVRSQSGQENTLTMPGSVLCQEKSLLMGFKELVREINALVDKYQPTLETQFAHAG